MSVCAVFEQINAKVSASHTCAGASPAIVHTCVDLIRMHSCVAAVSRFAKIKAVRVAERVEEKAVTNPQNLGCTPKKLQRKGVETKEKVGFFSN